jgi:hypothetical protein
MILSSFGAPSFSGGSSFETLDFSLPSYDEAVKEGTTESKVDASVGAPASRATLNDPQVSASPPTSIPAAAPTLPTVSQVKDIQKKPADDDAVVAAEKKKADLQLRRALEKQKQL